MTYKTIEDLEKINFKQLPQDERLTIILAIVDESNDIRQFNEYFSPEDIKVLELRCLSTLEVVQI